MIIPEPKQKYGGDGSDETERGEKVLNILHLLKKKTNHKDNIFVGAEAGVQDAGA